MKLRKLQRIFILGVQFKQINHDKVKNTYFKGFKDFRFYSIFVISKSGAFY